MKLIKKITAVVICLSIMLITAGCGEQGSEYDYLKQEIVGVWMDEGGPSVSSDNPFGKSLVFYEFTSDNMIYYHYINNTVQPGIVSDGTQEGGSYHFEDNIFVFDKDNTGALVRIEGDTLIMSNNTEETRYTRVSVPDAAGYGVFFKDKALLREENIVLYGEEYVSASESESISISESLSEAALTASETENTETSAEETTAETVTGE